MISCCWFDQFLNDNFRFINSIGAHETEMWTATGYFTTNYLLGHYIILISFNFLVLRKVDKAERKFVTMSIKIVVSMYMSEKKNNEQT